MLCSEGIGCTVQNMGDFDFTDCQRPVLDIFQHYSPVTTNVTIRVRERMALVRATATTSTPELSVLVQLVKAFGVPRFTYQHSPLNT
jgi:hypothetical protein